MAEGDIHPIEAIHERLKVLFRFIYFLPTVTASVGVALIWGYLYHPQRGLINMIIMSNKGLFLPADASEDARQSLTRNDRIDFKVLRVCG